MELIGIYCFSQGPNKGAWTQFVQLKLSRYHLWHPDAQDAEDSIICCGITLYVEHYLVIIFQLRNLEIRVKYYQIAIVFLNTLSWHMSLLPGLCSDGMFFEWMKHMYLPGSTSTLPSVVKHFG